MIQQTAPVSESPESQFASGLKPSEKAELIRDIYNKHAAELLAIEDAQQKLTLLLLSVFGAGATFLASDKMPAPSILASSGLTLVVLGMVAVGWRYTKRRDHARQSVRELLFECEKALGLFEVGIFRPNASLYCGELKNFPLQGYWLSYTFWIAALAAAGFLIVLWAPRISLCLHA